MRYHVNGVGDPGLCKAEKGRCPFGSVDEHYPDAVSASRAWERKHDSPLAKKIVRRPFKELNDDELREKAKELLASKFKKRESYSDEEYELHREWLRRIRELYPTTQEEYSSAADGVRIYRSEREALHRGILATLQERFSSAKAEGKTIFTGGLPSAGKTTMLKRTYGDELNNYVLINPDLVKELMAERGLTPEIPGTLPLETNPMIHDESQHITNRLYQWALDNRLNLVVDKTMYSAQAVKDSIHELNSLGYGKPEALFVDMGVHESYRGLVKRHREGLDEAVTGEGSPLGERAVSGLALAIVEPQDPNYRSVNSESFSQLLKEEVFGKAALYDRGESEAVEVPAGRMEESLSRFGSFSKSQQLL